MAESLFKKMAVAVALATVLGGQALAQADLVSSTPAANAVVTDKVQQIALTFSTGVAIDLSKVTVRGPRGLLRTTAVAYLDNTVVLVAFWNTLVPGQYTVDWRVVSTDKHKSQGAYSFTIKSS